MNTRKARLLMTALLVAIVTPATASEPTQTSVAASAQPPAAPSSSIGDLVPLTSVDRAPPDDDASVVKASSTPQTIRSNDSEVRTVDFTLKTNITGAAQSGRDFGLNNRTDTRTLYLDATPWVHVNFSRNWAGFLRARLFAPTSSVLPQSTDNNHVRASGNTFVALKEGWIEYRGLTSYPGESLRLGRQRIRDTDAEWWDDDIESLRWIFDTTLLRANLAVAHQFSTYRSDSAPVPRQQKDRTYILGSIGTQLTPDFRIGLRAARADDSRTLPAAGQGYDSNKKLRDAHLNWLGIYIDNGFFRWHGAPALTVWNSDTWVYGHERQALTDSTTQTVTGHRDDRVMGFAVDGGARYRLPIDWWPINVGVVGVYSSGSGTPGHDFEQTGLQSNSSRFTGTRTLINRFNDAYRAELGNLTVFTGFISTQWRKYDASVIYSHFQRPDGDGPVVTDGISVEPVNNAKQLGNGYDLVLTRYLGGDQAPLPNYLPDEDSRSSIRLRASLFQPGSAYGPGAKDEYRAELEFIWWY